MNKLKIGILGVFLSLFLFPMVSAFVDNSSLVQSVDGCGTLSTVNAVYNLNKSINAVGDCFIINNKNITFKLNGFSVIGNTAGDGISATAWTNLTISNGTVSNFSTGVKFIYVSNSQIKNINSNSNSMDGMDILSSSGNNFTNINSNSNSMDGIYLSQSSNNSFFNITSNNNAILFGIESLSSSGNQFDDITINLNGLYFELSSNNIITDSDITAIQSISYSLNNSAINSTYSIEIISGSSQLIRKWYVDVQVLDPPVTPINKASVTIKDIKGNIWTSLTNSLGLTPLFALVGYVNQGGVKEIVSYTATAKKGRDSNSVSFNVTNNQRITVTLCKQDKDCGKDYYESWSNNSCDGKKIIRSRVFHDNSCIKGQCSEKISTIKKVVKICPKSCSNGVCVK